MPIEVEYIENENKLAVTQEVRLGQYDLYVVLNPLDFPELGPRLDLAEKPF